MRGAIGFTGSGGVEAVRDPPFLPCPSPSLFVDSLSPPRDFVCVSLSGGGGCHSSPFGWSRPLVHTASPSTNFSSVTSIPLLPPLSPSRWRHPTTYKIVFSHPSPRGLCCEDVRGKRRTCARGIDARSHAFEGFNVQRHAPLHVHGSFLFRGLSGGCLSLNFPGMDALTKG